MITKKKSGNTVFYKANFIPESEESSQQSEESSLLSVKKVHSESEESSHNILDINSNKEFLNSSSTSLKSKPPRFTTEKQTKKRESKTEQNTQYLASLSKELFDNSEICTEKLISYLTPRQPTKNPAHNKTSWQVEFAHFLESSKISASCVCNVIDYAFNSSWQNYTFAPKNIISNFDKMYQQLHSKPTGRQKQIDDALSRGNMDTGSKDYTIF